MTSPNRWRWAPTVVAVLSVVGGLVISVWYQNAMVTTALVMDMIAFGIVAAICATGPPRIAPGLGAGSVGLGAILAFAALLSSVPPRTPIYIVSGFCIALALVAMWLTWTLLLQTLLTWAQDGANAPPRTLPAEGMLQLPHVLLARLGSFSRLQELVRRYDEQFTRGSEKPVAWQLPQGGSSAGLAAELVEEVRRRDPDGGAAHIWGLLVSMDSDASALRPRVRELQVKSNRTTSASSSTP